MLINVLGISVPFLVRIEELPFIKHLLYFPELNALNVTVHS